ncbi:MAG: hypothetical protein M0R17_10970 [Candidatus Omnitrophica bacterium]|jgi:hypothetical protein|nr:hypothetical protein [Candidatus Omnitrophota bacterium]
MDKKFDFQDLLLLFIFPFVIALLTKLLNTWSFVIVYGVFGLIFGIGITINKLNKNTHREKNYRAIRRL